MSIPTRPRARLGLGLGTGVALATLGLILAPLTANADDAAPPEPAAEASVAAPPEAASVEAPAPDASTAEPAAEASGAVEATPPAPPSVVVAEPGTTAEDVLAEPVDEPTVTLFAEAAPAADATDEGGGTPLAPPAPGDPCYPAVCIDNGTILLAVNPTGELNTADATGSAAGDGDAGLDFLPTSNDATSPGCLCEGWGVADPVSGVWGAANLDQFGTGGANLELVSFEHTASTATSVVNVLDGDGHPVMRVTHEYVPSSATPNLYQVNVTIENLTGATIATVQYRRVMDWDIEPTAFDEFVTIDGGTASALVYTSDDGFASSNPLDGPSEIAFHGNAVDSGPADHGALFDFAFGPLAAGAKLGFVIFYGAAANEAEAQAALAAVGAEAYSFGQTRDDPAGGTPNTFIFAFGKVGGAPIFTPPGAPAPVPAAPPAGAAQPVVAVAPVADSAPALASTGVRLDGGLFAALAAVLAGLVLLIAGAVVRSRRA